MKTLSRCLCTMLLLLALVGMAQADPVLWETNGHYYEAIAYPSGITWDEAKTVAEGRTHLGLGGHLATVTSMDENSFILDHLGGPNILNGFFLGGYQPEGSPEPGGNWQWLTGEPWSFTNWFLGMPEPNNAYAGDGIFPGTTGTSEEVLQFWNSDGTWNDMSHSAGWGGLIVEYEPSAPIDEPILEMDALYGAGTLSLDFFLGTPGPAIWGTYLILFAHTPIVVPLWQVPLPQIVPAIDVPIDFACPSLGQVLIYSCLYDRDGVQIKDFGWVDTAVSE